MTAQKLDGTATLKAIKEELKVRVAALKEQGVVPGLGTVLVGDDPGSHWYVGAKHKDCAEIGIESIRVDLPATATQAEVEAEIDRLNADPGCTGFLIQQPTGLDEFALLSQQRTAAAQAAGRFDDEIVPLPATRLVTDRTTGERSSEIGTLGRDEGNRPTTTIENLGRLVPVLPQGLVTSAPSVRALAASSNPMKPAPITTRCLPGSSRARIATASSSVRR